MRIFRDINALPFSSSVVSVGSYDGVHLGHRKLLSCLLEEASRRNAEPVLMTFDPHPKKVLGISNGFLSTLEEQILLLDEIGVQNLVLMPFTETFSRMSAEDFVRDVLCQSLHAVAAVMGEDHTFGKGGKGNYSSFTSMGVEPVRVDLVDNIGSTDIRRMVRTGDMERASELLGGGYLVITPVMDECKILPPAGRYLALIDGVEVAVDVPNLPSGKELRILKKI